MCVCVVGVGDAWGCLEVVQWVGWLGQEHDLDLERRQCLRVMVQGRGVGWGVRRWGAGFAPLMKIRSVFGTCMVSGIRRREKVRE